MAIEEFREPTYPMRDAINARMVFAMMLRELNKKREFAPAGQCFSGTYTCPYCYRDEPHTVNAHDDDRDRLESVMHSDAQLLDAAGVEWARGRLEKLYHAPRFEEPRYESSSVGKSGE